MAKIINSPVKKWPGTVTLSDPLTFPQSIAVEDALAAAGKLENPTPKRVHYTLLPGLLKCVEAWGLGGDFPQNPTPETFPSTPSESSNRLVFWLVEEITDLYLESEEVPLAS